MSDNQPCDTSFDEQRERAVAEFMKYYPVHPADAAWALNRQLERIAAAEAKAEERKRLSLEAVKDNDAVGRLAHAMRAKLAMTRETRGGWWTEGCTSAHLATMLRVCVEKGDPVDVANLCAFLHARGERIPSANRPGDGRNEAVAEAECDAKIGRLVPRGVPEEGPRNDAADALAYAFAYDLGEERTEPQGWMAAPVRGAGEFAVELRKARQKLPTMASAHEGLAIIAEEFDKLKALVWQKQSERDYAAMRKETIQLGAMVLAFLREIVEPENRR